MFVGAIEVENVAFHHRFLWKSVFSVLVFSVLLYVVGSEMLLPVGLYDLTTSRKVFRKFLLRWKWLFQVRIGNRRVLASDCYVWRNPTVADPFLVQSWNSDCLIFLKFKAIQDRISSIRQSYADIRNPPFSFWRWRWCPIIAVLWKGHILLLHPTVCTYGKRLVVGHNLVNFFQCVLVLGRNRLENTREKRLPPRQDTHRSYRVRPVALNSKK